jgi:hypothetical protein
MQAQRQLLNWLFTVQGAGIAGSLGYLTSKGMRTGIAVALSAFVLGLLAVLMHATLFYYFEERRFGALNGPTTCVEWLQGIESNREWHEETGHMTKAMLSKYIDDLAVPIYYIAGPQGMVASMRKVLTESGVNDDNIRTEEFTGY